MSTVIVRFAGVLSLTAFVSFANGAEPSGAPTAVEVARVPAGGLQPQSQVDAAGTVHLVYFQGAAAAGDLFYVSRKSGAANWSEPLRVNTLPESAIAIGSIRGAQLSVGASGRVHVTWNGSQKAQPRAAGRESTPVLYTRLNEAKTAFEPERNLIQLATGLDGGGSVAAGRDGRVSVVWHASAGARNEDDRRVWVSTSTDDGRTFAKETAVDVTKSGVCGCCSLKAFVNSRGNLSIFYRSAKALTDRDMHFLESRGEGADWSDTLVSPWPISTCPMSSCTVTESTGVTCLAWETDGQVSFTRLDPKTGKPGPQVGAPGKSGNRKHPVLAVDKRGHSLLVWTEGTGWQRGGALAWQEFDAHGQPTSVKGRQSGIPVWSFASVFARPGGRFTILY